MIVFSPPCLEGTLIERRKRFLADIRLDSGQTILAHCPNTGALKGLSSPGTRVAVSEIVGAAEDRCGFVWQMALEDGVWVGVNTQNPNRLVKAYLNAHREAWGYDVLTPEKRLGEGNRMDFFLQGPGKIPWLIEVKTVHWKRGEAVWFPDGVTQRGARHMRVLQSLASGTQENSGLKVSGLEKFEKCRATMMYVVQRSDATVLALAKDIDPTYAEAVTAAKDVSITAYGCYVSPAVLQLKGPLPLSVSLSSLSQQT